MKEIKTDADVEGLRASSVRPEVAALVARRLQEVRDAYDDLDAVYDPDADGHPVVFEAGDDLELLTGMEPERLVALAEYVERHEAEGAWELVLVPSNSWAWVYILPDELALPAGVTALLAMAAGATDKPIPTTGQQPAPF